MHASAKDRHHRPEGRPTGGQFVQEANAASGLDLDPATVTDSVLTHLNERKRWTKAGQDDPDFGMYLLRNLGDAGIAQYVREGVDLDDVRAAHANGVELEPGGFIADPVSAGGAARQSRRCSGAR